MQRAIVDVQRSSNGLRGSHLQVKRRGKHKSKLADGEDNTPIEFQIVNPISLLPKE
jgi:hypothetical protein